MDEDLVEKMVWEELCMGDICVGVELWLDS